MTDAELDLARSQVAMLRSGDTLTAFGQAVARSLESLLAERDRLQSRLDFLKTKGVTVGVLKDQHGERLAYDIARGSELCDLKTMGKLTEAEVERDRLKAERDALAAKCTAQAARIAELESEIKEARTQLDLDDPMTL